jgi:hypothetical protein
LLVAVAVLTTGVALRLWLLHAYPVMPFGDGYTRLLDVRTLVKPPWLPGLQATLALTSMVSTDLAAFRGTTALHGCAAALAATLLSIRLWGPGSALLAGISLATLPTFVLPSIGVYQEPLFLALACAGAALLLSDDRGRSMGGLLIGLASLVRYEGWPLAGLAALWLWRAEGAAARRGLASTLALAGPLAWLTLGPDTAQGGMAHLDPSLSLERISARVAVLGRLVADAGLHPLPVLALAGLAAPGGPTLGALLLADVLWLAVLDPYSSVDNPRQFAIPCLLLLLLVAGAARRSRAMFALTAMVGVLPGLLAWPRALDGYGTGVPALVAATARALDGRVDESHRVLVLAQGLRDWPEAGSSECEGLAVGLGRPTAVVCDQTVQPGALSGGFDAWSKREHIAWIIQFAPFEPWREVQRAATGASDWVLAVELPGGGTVWGRGGADLELPADFPGLPRSPACVGLRERLRLPEGAQVHGAAVGAERDRVAFYTNGTLRFTVPEAGELALWLCGTPAEGRGPRATVEAGGRGVQHEAGVGMRRLSLGEQAAGTEIILRYADDVVADGEDRNLFLGGVEWGGGGP